jgi:hypothetical protein
MKNLILISLISLNISCGNQTTTIPKTIKNDTTLKAINDSLQKITVSTNTKVIEKEKTIIVNIEDYEDSIEEALASMFVNKNFKEIDAKLNLISNDTEISTSNKTYWKCYIFYNKSIFFKTTLKDDDNASKTIDLAIENLEKNPKTSEDFALLAACKSFSIQFANMTQLSKISGEVLDYANKALELNSKNIRAYYVLASNNFYTPKMFGGMSKVEEYSLTGLACPNTLNDDTYSPYWGKPKLYALYIKYLETENRKEDAEKYKIIAKKEFPN